VIIRNVKVDFDRPAHSGDCARLRRLRNENAGVCRAFHRVMQAGDNSISWNVASREPQVT